MKASFLRRVQDFERVLHAAYPTVTDPKLQGMGKLVMKTLSAWRYQTGFYHFPLELRVVNRLFPYERPETAGF